MYAIIDIGSNSTKLFIYKKDLKIKDFYLYQTKLINYLKDNILTKEGLNILDKSLKYLTKSLEDENLFILATYTIREAKNKDKILKILKKYSDNIYILDGYKEAYFTHLAIRYLNKIKQEDFLSINLGGGSLEFYTDKKFISYNIGALNLYKEKNIFNEISQDFNNYKGKIYITGSTIQYCLYIIYGYKRNPCIYNDKVIHKNNIKFLKSAFIDENIIKKYPFLKNKIKALKGGIYILDNIINIFNKELYYSCANITLGFLIEYENKEYI